MALLRDYEVPNTGLTVTGAYHVISSIKLDKRTADVPDPVESGTRDSSNAVHWQAGYIAVVTVDVYASAEARNGGKVAVGKVGSPSSFEYKFVFDTTASDGIMEQAYAYLKTTSYYSTASDA